MRLVSFDHGQNPIFGVGREVTWRAGVWSDGHSEQVLRGVSPVGLEVSANRGKMPTPLRNIDNASCSGRPELVAFFVVRSASAI